MTKSIDVGAILQTIPALKPAMDGRGNFKLPNMFGARRRLDDDIKMEVEVPTIMKLAAGEINVGSSDTKLRRLYGTTEATYVHNDARMLEDPEDTFKFNYKTYVLDGSQCALTLNSMPKKISCTLLLKLGKLNLEIHPEFELVYDLNGIDFLLVARAKTKLTIGTVADYKSITGYEKMQDIDIGGLLDDSLSGTITMVPVGIEFPKTGLFEIARIPLKMIKAEGACLGKFY